MFGKKTTLERCQTSPHLLNSAPCPRTQRRAPGTPPLSLKGLPLVAKKPESGVVLRDRGKFKGHVSGIRDSWPGAGPNSSERRPRMIQRSMTPPSWVPTTAINQSALSQNSCLPATQNPHWPVPVRAPPTGLGSQATLMSLLLFFRR